MDADLNCDPANLFFPVQLETGTPVGILLADGGGVLAEDLEEMGVGFGGFRGGAEEGEEFGLFGFGQAVGRAVFTD